MIRNFLKITLRNIYRHKAYSAISVLGLAIGFSAFILISLFINYEYSWDKHNVNYDRIYRVQRFYPKAVHATNGNDISPHNRAITAKLLDETCPEIEKIALFRENRGVYLASDPQNQIYDEYGFCGDSVIFDVFTYEFLEGFKENALKEPYTIVLSKTMANKLFPDGSALGKTIVIEKKFNMKVTGVYADLPMNSVIRPTYIASLSTIEQVENVKTSMNTNYYTYILLKPGANPNALKAKIKYLFKPFKNAEDEELQLCPLSMIYLSFNGNKDYLTILFIYTLIGLFILILAGMNYINLTTANSALRTREIGVRKVQGSSQSLLVVQFLGEAIFTSFLAVGIAFILTENILPLFNHVIDKEMKLSYLTQWGFTLEMLGIALLTGLLSGLYPAFIMSSTRLTNLFKGNPLSSGKDKIGIRKVLVTIQFSIAILLIILSLIFKMQIDYILSKDLGFNKNNLLYAKLSVTRMDGKYEDLRNRILSHPEIIDFSMSRHIPMISFGGYILDWEGCKPGDIVEARDNYVSYDFVKTMGMQIVSGRDFSREFPSDAGKSCIINETAAKVIGWDNPIGKRVSGNKYQVVGVVKDFHNNDMYNTIEPFLMMLEPDSIQGGNYSLGFRISGGNLKKSKAIITAEMEQYFPNDPFEVKEYFETFSHQNILRIYNEIRNLVLFFTILAVIIAIIGLLGLVSFNIQRRTKEIGIRKILGGSNGNIFGLLSREYIVLLSFSSLLSWPLSLILNHFLPGTYKCPLTIWPFIFSSGIVLIIILILASYQTYRASVSNPVDALRYE
jgi:putative ABC transport system permease protein